jgi:predicted ATPase
MLKLVNKGLYKMYLEIENIGHFKKTKIEIDGITVVAGENQTGKSILAKSLYSVFHGYSNINKKIFNMRKNFLIRDVQQFFRDSRVFVRNTFIEIVCEKILQSKNENDIKNLLNSLLKKNVIKDKKIDINKLYDNIKMVLSIKDDEILAQSFFNLFDSEYSNQIVNISNNQNGIINLFISENKIGIKLLNNVIKGLNRPKVELVNNVVFFDDPFILDELNRQFDDYSSVEHRNELCKMIKNSISEKNIIEKLVVKERLEKIYKLIDTITSGEIMFDKNDGNFKYKIDNTNNEKLHLKNLATGLKTFAIIKQLLAGNILRKKGILILDEPEVHLHPEWQLKFAEILVLLQKEFDLHILINTHSDYFVEAIELYSKLHKIAEKCQYYLTNNIDDAFFVKTVTNNTEKIYSKFVKPFDKLDVIEKKY